MVVLSTPFLFQYQSCPFTTTINPDFLIVHISIIRWCTTINITGLLRSYNCAIVECNHRFCLYLKLSIVCIFRVSGSKPVILNRGPHGPPGGNLQVLGGNTEHLGNWGGMDPFGGNQQIAINSPGCSSGWRIVAASPVPSAQRITTDTGHFGHSAQTKMDTAPMKDNNFWLRGIHTSDKNGNALPAQRIKNFPSKFGS